MNKFLLLTVIFLIAMERYEVYAKINNHDHLAKLTFLSKVAFKVRSFKFTNNTLNTTLSANASSTSEKASIVPFHGLFIIENIIVIFGISAFLFLIISICCLGYYFG